MHNRPRERSKDSRFPESRFVFCVLCNQTYDTWKASTSWHVVNVLPDSTFDPEYHRPLLDDSERVRISPGLHIICHQRKTCRLRQKGKRPIRVPSDKRQHHSSAKSSPNLWRIVIRLRYGIDDDLIGFLEIRHGKRAIDIREAVRNAIVANISYHPESIVKRSSGTNAKDVRVTVRFFLEFRVESRRVKACA